MSSEFRNISKLNSGIGIGAYAVQGAFAHIKEVVFIFLPCPPAPHVYRWTDRAALMVLSSWC